MARFGIRTIPALVLLDANGAVTSLDGRGLITSALAKHSLAASDGLPPAPQLGTPGTRQPGGDPPSFPPGLLAFPTASERSTRGQMTRAPQVSPPGKPTLQSMAPAADIHPLPVSEKQHDPPTARATPRPPPKPNLTRGKWDVTFALPPGQTSLQSPKQKKIWRSPGTSYVFTPAQVTLMAGATESAPQDAEDPQSMFSKPPSPLANDIQQGEHCSLMQPQPLADVHPFTPVMNEWRQGIKVD
jgi:hypothetical protein